MTIERKMFKRAVAGAVLVLCLAGCSTTKSTRHIEAVKAQDQHWKQMRSASILQSAEGYFIHGDLDNAELTLLEAISVDPENPQLHILAGRVALERGQLERAFGRFETAIKRNDKISEAHYYQGIVLERWQRHEVALKRYREAYDLQRDNISYLLAVSEMLVASDQVDQAIELLASKVIYFDQSAVIRVSLGHLYAMKKDNKQAIQCFSEALLLTPDDHAIREELAMAHFHSEQYAQAIRLLRDLVKQEKLDDRRDLRHMLGQAYLYAGQTSKARDIYMELRRSDPKDADAWHKIGELAWQEKDYSAALTASRRVISLSPDRYEGYLLGGMVLQHRGKAQDALEMFDRAADLAPQSAEPLILRGITLHRQGRSKEAAAAYTEALRRQPEDRRARKLLAALAMITPG